MVTSIGVLKNGTEVTISNNSLNSHVAILGISGSGKSTRLKEINVNRVQNGETVICFDLEGVDADYPDEILNHIDLHENGLKLKILDDKHIIDGDESMVNFIAYVTELIAGSQNMGVRQLGVLREAVQYSLQHNEEYKNDMEAIANALLLMDSNCSKGVYNKLWSTLCSNAFRNDGKTLKTGMINVISLGKMPSSSQKTLVEIILGIIWRESRFLGIKKQKLNIVLDEFQRLHLEKKSVLTELFTQGFKYGINVTIATQSSAFLSNEVTKAVNQADTKLFFKPALSDVRKIAEMIDDQKVEKYVMMLKKLRVGECIAVGTLCLGHVEHTDPVVVQSTMALRKSDMSISKIRMLEKKFN